MSYGPYQKWLRRLDERTDLPEEHVAIKLPRISFTAEAPVYDPDRQLTKLQYRRVGTTKVFVPAPYRIPFELHVMTKNEDEAHQILEQIYPYFKPSLGMKIKPSAESDDIIDEIKLTLLSISKQDDYEGEFTSRRIMIHTLSFDMLMNYYGNVAPGEEGTVIKKVITNFVNEDFDTTEQTITTEVNPLSANEGDEYTIEVTCTNGIE